MNKTIILSVITIIIAGICVSRIKYEVVFLKKTLKTLDKELEKCNDNIKILNAEWGCLNNPKRLKKLVGKYFPDMKPVGYTQVIRYKDIIEGNLIVTNNTSSINSLLDSALGG
jgi:hypothetical protein